MESLELRKRIKKKKPDFIRQDAHKRKKLAKIWRRPSGHQSKMRHGIRGYRKSVEPGYGSPRSAAGLHKSGARIIQVSNMNGLELVGKGEAAVISSRVGAKKRVAILKKAKEMGVKVLNIKDIEAYIKGSEERISKKKEEKKKAEKKKEEKKKEIEKKAKEKKGEGLAEKVTEEEKKEEEKKEKDKLLIKQEK